MSDVKFVTTLKQEVTANTRIWQTLWKHVPSGEYVVVSSSVVSSDVTRSLGVPDEMVNETMAFASNEYGSWDPEDLAVDYPAKWTKKDHENIANVAQKNRVEKNAENTEDEL